MKKIFVLMYLVFLCRLLIAQVDLFKFSHRTHLNVLGVKLAWNNDVSIYKILNNDTSFYKSCIFSADTVFLKTNLEYSSKYDTIWHVNTRIDSVKTGECRRNKIGILGDKKKSKCVKYYYDENDSLIKIEVLSKRGIGVSDKIRHQITLLNRNDNNDLFEIHRYNGAQKQIEKIEYLYDNGGVSKINRYQYLKDDTIKENYEIVNGNLFIKDSLCGLEKIQIKRKGNKIKYFYPYKRRNAPYRVIKSKNGLVVEKSFVDKSNKIRRNHIYKYNRNNRIANIFETELIGKDKVSLEFLFIYTTFD